MKPLTVTQARSNLNNLLDEVADSHEPILITGKRSNAVLLSESDWESVQETLCLLSITGMGVSIREGLETAIDDCVDKLDW